MALRCRECIYLACQPILTSHQVTYEIQPPSYTALKLLNGPPLGGGGDTLWSSQYAVYDLLSPGMQKYLEGLEALHSAQIQADGSISLGRPVRRDPVISKHPLIRTNPVTGWKSVFFNPGFVTAIVGIPMTESSAIISYLNELISTTQEIHVRYQWQKNDVALWDNRVCVSTTTPVLIWKVLTHYRTTQLLMASLLTVVTLSVRPAMQSVQSSIPLASLKKMICVLNLGIPRLIRMDQASPTITTEFWAKNWIFGKVLLMLARMPLQLSQLRCTVSLSM